MKICIIFIQKKYRITFSLEEDEKQLHSFHWKDVENGWKKRLGWLENLHFWQVFMTNSSMYVYDQQQLS